MTITRAKNTARMDSRAAASSISFGGSPVRPGALPPVSGVASTGMWVSIRVDHTHKITDTMSDLPGMACFLRSAVFWSATALAVPALAQTQDEPRTRTEALQREREEKQQATKPYEANGLERAMRLGEGRIVPLLQRDGVYAKLGSLTTGSGFAYGAGFRDRSLVKGRGSLDVWAAASLKKYWGLEARARYPLIAGDRVAIEGYARQYGYPQEEFFGLGPESRRIDQTAFDLHGLFAGGQLAAQAIGPLSFGAGIEYLRPSVDQG